MFSFLIGFIVGVVAGVYVQRRFKSQVDSILEDIYK